MLQLFYSCAMLQQWLWLCSVCKGFITTLWRFQFCYSYVYGSYSNDNGYVFGYIMTITFMAVQIVSAVLQLRYNSVYRGYSFVIDMFWRLRLCYNSVYCCYGFVTTVFTAVTGMLQQCLLLWLLQQCLELLRL